jgi:hypothetical protein
MRASSLARAVLLWGALSGGAAFAKPPQEFKPPPEMTEEELAAAKARSKSSINDYGKDIPQETKPFPWLAAGIFFIAGLIALPFAIRSYLATSKAIGGNQPFGGKGRARD